MTSTTVDIEHWVQGALDRYSIVYTDPKDQRVYRVATRETEWAARVPYPLPVRWSEPWRRFGAKIRRTDLLTSYEGLKSR